MNKQKNITMRGNKQEDMEFRLKKKHTNAVVLDKGSVCNNFNAGGYKYYQHFWCEIKEEK